MANYFRIAELENVEDDGGDQAKKKNDDTGPCISSEIQGANSEKVNLSRKQFFSRRKKTLAALCPILDSCARAKMKLPRDNKPVLDGGLISKKKYTNIRNSSDVVRETEKKKKNMKTEFMTGCEVPNILPYKTLMSFVRSIEIGEVLSLDDLAGIYSLKSTSGVYRPLKPFLLKLAELYLFLDSKTPYLHWFNGEKGVLHVATGADGAPFGKDDTATDFEKSFQFITSAKELTADNLRFTRAPKGHSILSPERKEVVTKLKTLILAMHSMITDDLSIQLG
ncbi:hypothetical protein AWC38_SpisGene17693 [Stylophora pistillata]|uniref:Uncharacterized protein n=1 Tax=Stylophora pistillata TaxID=50429 RepID=A0A2B4RNN9_STYPI|nr:hypothetical protein AWC38_SpisGene17693 [Stylophora pistillata]